MGEYTEYEFDQQRLIRYVLSPVGYGVQLMFQALALRRSYVHRHGWQAEDLNSDLQVMSPCFKLLSHTAFLKI